MVEEPNQGATGGSEDEESAPATGTDPGPAGAGAPINPGGPGAGPEGGSAYEPGAEAHSESPLSVPSEQDDVFAARPELFVGGAFVGGFALAQILKRFGP